MSDGSAEEVGLNSGESRKQRKRASYSGRVADTRNPAHFIPTGTVLAKSAISETSLVYKGRSENVYVMKKLKKSLVLSHVSERRLRASVELHLALSHPCLIKLLYFLEDREAFYLVSEHAARGSLLAQLSAQQALGEEEAFGVFVDCLSALNHLHEQGVRPKQLRLEDVLRVDGGVRLSAFSLGALLRQGEEERRPAQLPPEFGAPLPAEGPPPAWLLGGLLVQLLTGDLRARSSDAGAALDAYLRSPDFAALKVSAECHSFVRFLLRPQPAALADVLQHPWVAAMQQSGRRSSKEALKSLLRAGRSGSLSSQQPTAKKRISLTSSKKEEPELSPPSKQFSAQRDGSTAGDKNYWHRKSRFAEVTDISMSSPRFFDTRPLAQSGAAERAQKLRNTQKGFFQQIAEALGCAARD